MAPKTTPVKTSEQMPKETTVVVIGGGIVGLTAALTLIERGISVTVLEKGYIAGEQSSRNLGWIRKTSRLKDDVPLAQASDRLWAEMSARVGAEVGYRQSGIMFAARDDAQMGMYENWLKSVEVLDLDSRILSRKEIDHLIPKCTEKWKGGIYTPSDGCAEPTLAASAIAQAALNKGVIIVENCAVRTLSMTAGKVSGVVTEKGEIRCDQVLLAGGLWSRKFLGNLGINFPTLPLICSVFHTDRLPVKTEIAFGAPDFSFRKHRDGGFIITQRGALDAPLTLDHLLIGTKYLDQLRHQRGFLRIGVKHYSLKDLTLARRWSAQSESPFEKIRTLDPISNMKLNQEALTNLKKAWPQFNEVNIKSAWAGVIDVTPDSTPVIGPVSQIPGLTLATGFSGHGFGTSPAAGQLAADLLSGHQPIIHPAPYTFERFQM